VKQAHILVIEDDRDVRDAIVDGLEDAGYSVTSAVDGADALSLLDASTIPDLILLDLMMPNMNGYQFRRQQMKRTDLAAIPVAVITAHGSARDHVEKLQVDGSLKKPFKLAELMSVVENILRGRTAV
jgi:two-component system response regulator MprA